MYHPPFRPKVIIECYLKVSSHLRKLESIPGKDYVSV